MRPVRTLNDGPRQLAGFDGKPAPVTYIPERREETDDELLFKRGCNSGINFDKYDSIEVAISGPDNVKKKITDFDQGGRIEDSVCCG